MTIDFTFSPEVEDVRMRVRRFMEEEVKAVETEELWESSNRRKLVETIILRRHKAQQVGLWMPHMPRAYKIEVSYCKHHVANTLWRVIDRAVQVHGALGYSNDSPLSKMLTQARWARFADGADEIHQMRIAQLLMQAYGESGSVRRATGDLPV